MNRPRSAMLAVAVLIAVSASVQGSARAEVLARADSAPVGASTPADGAPVGASTPADGAPVAESAPADGAPVAESAPADTTPVGASGPADEVPAPAMAPAAGASAAPPRVGLVVDLGVGLPAPLRSLGQNTRGQATRQSPPRIPLTVEADLGLDGVARGRVRPTAIASLSVVRGRGAARASRARWCIGGAGADLVWRPTSRIELAAGPTVGALAFTWIVDESLRLDTTSVGGGLGAAASWSLSPRWRTRLRVRSWWFAPPLNRDDWFNQPLGSTHLVTVTLGAAWTSR